ncbi:MAG: CocE/NonD family hydrolase [Gammaproteobacteria bacterium]
MSSQQVHIIDHTTIPMSDGVRLAARIWLPEDAEDNPVPAILEYIPYRLRDGTFNRDNTTHPYFAAHGYAAVRVDIRGSGNSEGVLEDEYLEQELVDGEEIMYWLAQQTWCDGNVGIIGISWGGFNGLQLAARRPPQLKAVITICSTDDRYADDVHYMGGCLLGDQLSWASTMFAYNSLPPDPALVGDIWRDMWRERIDGSGLWLNKWLQHQYRDDYWKHGSICEDFSDVNVPVFAVSGWADGYTNAVFRLMEGLDVPRHGLVGPWSHLYPHMGEPGPAIGFLQECVRWWNQWLKGRETGIMDEPMLQVWMQDSMPPTTSYKHRRGRWVGEPSWPTDNVESLKLVLNGSRLQPEEDTNKRKEKKLTVQSPLTCGLFAGKWCSYAIGPDLAHDQREDDGGALTFDTRRLKEDLNLLGSPVLELELAADKPVAMIAVRLSDVAPDDKATRVTYGVLNLTHRDSHEHPEALEPGRRYRVRVPMNSMAQVFPRGHRLRLSVSTSYWPIAWPPPEPVRLTIYDRASRLVLPKRLADRSEDSQIGFGPPDGTPAEPLHQLKPSHHNWYMHRDLATDKSTLEVINDDGTVEIESLDLEKSKYSIEWYSSVADNFDSIRGETLWERGYKRNDWQVKTVTRTILTSDRYNFYIHANLDAYEGERRVFSRIWDYVVPRELV